MPSAWRTVRVFVSSTFRDMHAERNHLVRVVFPALRERLEPFRVHLIDIDLRWGVTREQAENSQVLDLCLRFVDECRPFFLGIVGERYGWIPDRLSSEILTTFDWLRDHQDRSLTEIEIHHAVLQYPQTTGRAFFYFRDPAALDGVPDQIARDVYLEPAPDRAGKLRELKDRIRRSGFPIMESYPARWESGQLVGLEAFDDRAFEQLWQGIQAELRLGGNLLETPGSDPLAEEADYHDRFMESRLRVYVDRNTLEYQLRQYVGGATSRTCVVTGPSGSGKSAALAKLVAVIRQLHPDWLVLPHFVGASPDSTDLRRLLRRFCLVLQERFGSDSDIPSDLPQLSARFDRLIAEAPADARVVIVIDAVNQLDTTGNAYDLYWLPVTLPPNVKVVISCIETPGETSPVLDAINARPHDLVRVDALSDVERFQIVHDVPSLSAKTLDHTQVADLLANPATTNPLFLLVALEELRGFGSYEQLHERIRAFPREGDTVTALFAQVIERLEGDFGAGVVRRVLTCLAAARRGLSEGELRELVGSADVFPVLRQLRPYLQRRGTLVDFFHRNLFTAVHERYLSTVAEQTAAHSSLGDYFGGQEYVTRGAINIRKVDELPWQRLRARQWDAVENLFTEPAFLESKTEAGLVFDLASEFQEARLTIPSARTSARALRLFEEALRRDLHFIAAHPTALFQCFWNSCWWYDSPEATLYYETPDARSTEQPPWTQLEPRLFERLEAWRRTRAFRERNHPWLRSLRPPARQLGEGQLAVLNPASAGLLSGLVFTQDNQRIASAWSHGTSASGPGGSTIQVWDTERGEQLRSFPEYPSQISSLSGSPDGRWIVSGAADGTLAVWNVATRGLVRAISAHAGPVEAVAFSRDGRYIASGPGKPGDPAASDGTIRIWNGDTLREVAVLRGHGDLVHSVAFSPDGRQLASGSADGTVRIWDCETATDLVVLPRSVRAVHAVAWFPDGQRIAAASFDKKIRVWNAVTGDELIELEGHRAGVIDLAVSSDGARIASGSVDGTVRLWDVATGENLRTFFGAANVEHVAFSPDDRWIASASNGVITLWDGVASEPIRPFRANVLGAIAMSNDGRVLAANAGRDTGRDNHAVRVCDFETGLQGSALKGAPRQVARVVAAALSFDGRRLATYAYDHAIRLWNTESGELEHVIAQGNPPQFSNVTSLAFSPDGRRIAAGTGLYQAPQYCLVHVWDAATGAPLHVLRGHQDFVNGVQFSPDGRELASASADGTVRLWNSRTGDLIRIFQPNAGREWLWRVYFSPDGQRLVAETHDAVVWGWDRDTGACTRYELDDPQAVAAGTSQFRLSVPVRSGDHKMELAITDHETRRPIAWWPVYSAFRQRVAHPSGRMWAGGDWVIALEDSDVAL